MSLAKQINHEEHEEKAILSDCRNNPAVHSSGRLVFCLFSVIVVVDEVFN